MVKYLLSLPQKLKYELQITAKTQGYSLNGLILFILWEWLKKQKEGENKWKQQ